MIWQVYHYGEKMEKENGTSFILTDYPSAWLDQALSITGKFEGRGYDNVSGNFDGQGISAGVLQWCFGQGSLQEKILKPYLVKHGSIDKLNIFPKPIMDSLAKASTSAGLRVAVIEMNNSKGVFTRSYHVRPDWMVAWRKFLLLPEVVELQKVACESVANQAIKLCHIWEMISLRAFCWFFDIVTQNGSMKGVTKNRPDSIKLINAINSASPKNKSLWSKRDLNDEQKILMIASWERSLLARAAYQKDVMDRKGTIAAGIGYVHGAKFENITWEDQGK